MKNQVAISNLLILLITAFTATCQEIRRDSIRNPENLFSSNELEELSFLVNSFDVALTDYYSENSLVCAYDKFAKEIYITTEQGHSIEYKEIIQSIFEDVVKTEVADEIWWIDSSSVDNNLSVNICHGGKYMEYLEIIGSKYPFINIYAQQLLKYEDLGAPHILSAFAMNSKDFDFSNINIRLIYAIHYLTFFNL